MTRQYSDSNVGILNKWGNSQGIRLPKAYCRQLGIAPGDEVKMFLIEDAIIIEKSTKTATLQERMKHWGGFQDTSDSSFESRETDFQTGELSPLNIHIESADKDNFRTDNYIQIENKNSLNQPEKNRDLAFESTRRSPKHGVAGFFARLFGREDA